MTHRCYHRCQIKSICCDCLKRGGQVCEAAFNGKECRDQLVRSEDFPGDPVVKTPPSNAGGAGLIPGQGTKIPHAPQ